MGLCLASRGQCRPPHPIILALVSSVRTLHSLLAFLSFFFFPIVRGYLIHDPWGSRELRAGYAPLSCVTRPSLVGTRELSQGSACGAT